MTTTIQQALRPLFITCFIIGLYVYPLNSSESRVKWVIYLSILYSATVWLVYGYLWYYIVSIFSLDTIFPTTISLIVIEINIITTITCAIFSIYYNKRLQMCIKKLNAVDDTLKELGSSNIYRKMHIWSKGVITGWIVYSFTLNFIDSLTWQILLIEKAPIWRFFVAHIYTYCLHVNTFVDSVFIIFLWYIGTRFDEVNKHMQNLLLKKEHWNTRKKPTIIAHQYTLGTNNDKRVLWSSMHLHLELCHIAREWNLIFGLQMTIEAASYPLSVTALSLYLYKFLSDTLEYRKGLSAHLWLRLINWTFVIVGKMYIFNYICENVSIKANKIDKIVNELSLQYPDSLREIHQFTLQTMHNPLKFTGMGFFEFGNKFLIKFCTTITTYVIIMVQMSNT
ncbi:PREDICTED: putative gustatory receptor 28b isoform X1 [Vollenhovia emeryi]|uniref:putative gustatory receptor 28b isoform X1 n=2 Tax=Vollenhovia emeryi TaxID=411798 RepID=UPI0005F58E80|nr:PREDICTED: putative gustatory receptor 28b isoform X1 [Vollenhovia emeryi]